MAHRRVIFISRLKPGSEQQLTHDLPVEFPAQALERIAGIKEVTICQGNGMFAAIIEYEGDFGQIYNQYLAATPIQAFHYKIAKFFESPPQSAEPAELPLVGDVFYWDGKDFHRAEG